MELLPDQSERVQKIVKFGLVAAAAGGVAVKIMLKKDGWGYAHLTDASNFFVGVVKEGRKELNQITGKLHTEVNALLSGEELQITVDNLSDKTDADIQELESYVGNGD